MRVPNVMQTMILAAGSINPFRRQQRGDARGSGGRGGYEIHDGDARAARYGNQADVVPAQLVGDLSAEAYLLLHDNKPNVKGYVKPKAETTTSQLKLDI